jgi:hypothetical protein
MKTIRKILLVLPILVALLLLVTLTISAFTGNDIENYLDVKWWGLFLLVEIWAEQKYQKLNDGE